MSELYQIAATCSACEWVGPLNQAFRARNRRAKPECPVCHEPLRFGGRSKDLRAAPPPPAAPKPSATLKFLEGLCGRRLNPKHFR